MGPGPLRAFDFGHETYYGNHIQTIPLPLRNALDQRAAYDPNSLFIFVHHNNTRFDVKIKSLVRLLDKPINDTGKGWLDTDGMDAFFVLLHQQKYLLQRKVQVDAGRVSPTLSGDLMPDTIIIPTNHWVSLAKDFKEDFDPSLPLPLTRDITFARWLAKEMHCPRGETVLKVQRIFIPICNVNHWVLAVILPGCHKIAIYDSLETPTQTVVEQVARRKRAVGKILERWFRWQTKKDGDNGSVMQGPDEKTSLMYKAGSGPQQKNMKDCGVFVCTTALCLARGYAPTYTAQQIKAGYQRYYIAHILAYNGWVTDSAPWELPTVSSASSLDITGL
jgi:Ulp1 family protease catalytic subunit